ncbi:hypothetical protein [Thiohalobacter thiocyanaticus]|uniref:TnsA endonuclease N-terminal domain-containing protein n=1 Tax=Thiohalobacter thiocyanaticus TaxID=585455 RepID=A0A426QKI2_9GAMM|nr:hypothetical protein [Thiohalobacter thiocyanaticus]RRQ22250.1 hypothetical protein D6C00_10015 [Thiohalobacter thiocyanaticus]
MDSFVSEDLASEPLCRIEWPEQPALRARKVVRRSNPNVTYKYPSIKLRRPVHCESKPEYFSAILHDVAPRVFTFGEQPATLRFRMNGQSRMHVPDLLVETAQGFVFKEVKSMADANDPFIRERTDYLASVLALQGYGCELLVEDEINLEPRISNAMYLQKYGRIPVTFIEEERFRRLIPTDDGMPWGEIIKAYGGVRGITNVCRLYIEGKVHIDIHNAWDSQTLITMKTR